MLCCACKQQVNWCSATKGTKICMELHSIFNIPTILKDGHLQVLKSKYVFHYPLFSMREKLSLDQRNIMNESPS